MRNQKGFGIGSVVVGLAVLAVIVATGWFVFNNNKSNTETDLTTNQSEATEQAPETSTQKQDYISVINSDTDQITSKKPSEVAKTKDQEGVLEAIYKYCLDNPPATQVIVNEVTFNDDRNYRQEGNHAYINSGCSEEIFSIDELIGSGLAHYLHKETNGSWIIDARTQDSPGCDGLDGKGYPSSIIGQCYDENGEIRSPQ